MASDLFKTTTNNYLLVTGKNMTLIIMKYENIYEYFVIKLISKIVILDARHYNFKYIFVLIQHGYFCQLNKAALCFNNTMRRTIQTNL